LTKYAVITENDESQWSDDTGVLYHFPKRYRDLIPPGTLVMYYKGKERDRAFAASRLSADPHYFGVAKIGEVFPDRASSKGDLFATIDDYLPFSQAVPIRDGGVYVETIPPNRAANHWRDGVRELSAVSFARILMLAGVSMEEAKPPELLQQEANGLESFLEGSKAKKFVTTYERDRRYRRQAIAIHGVKCFGCEEDMGVKYGQYAQGLIHVHHIVPVSMMDAPKKINPATDLVPVCPNCHSVIHRRREATLSVNELREMLGKGPKLFGTCA
jgi:predicted HNH restriction endonuclease